jgi:hypothetical protein
VATPKEDASAEVFLAGSRRVGHPAFSPDERWITYYSDASGRPEVYVRSVSGAGRQHQISRQGGTLPRWSTDGDQLFFVNGDSIYVATLTIGEDNVQVMDVRAMYARPGLEFDVLPGDSLFVWATSVGAETDEASRTFAVVYNFGAVLEALNKN